MEKHGARKPETRKTRNRWCWLIVQQSRRAKSDYVEGFSFIFGVTFFAVLSAAYCVTSFCKLEMLC